MGEYEYPKGLLEEPLLQRLLHSFLDMLQNPRSRLSIKISIKKTPELFQFDQYDVDYLWMLIQTLETDYQIISITLNSKRGISEELYEGATLTFHRDKEALVRDWLQRPLELTEVERWQQALADFHDHFTLDQLTLLMSNPIKHPEKVEREILESLSCIEQALNEAALPLSCRTLSARYFDGDSKFLDNRRHLLRQLFTDLQHKIRPRPILLSVAIPQIIDSILFVENQESFLDCVAQHTQPILCTTALVYTAGFRGAAEYIRNKEGVMFTHINEVTPKSKADFEQCWHDKALDFPCYFWGDLDYEGMRILASLRNTFPQLQAWQPGYDSMLRYHQKGVGHTPAAAHKELQRPIATTGCQYADTILLPLLHDTKRFLDQEVVSVLEDSVF